MVQQLGDLLAVPAPGGGRLAVQRALRDKLHTVWGFKGRVLVHKTMPGCGNLTPEYALAKANVCVGLLCSSRELRDKYQNDDGIGPKMPQLLGMATAAAAVGRPIAAFPGGVVCRDVGGNLVAAIGVSGAASDEDEHCSITAARAIGLSTEPAQSRLA